MEEPWSLYLDLILDETFSFNKRLFSVHGLPLSRANLFAANGGKT